MTLLDMIYRLSREYLGTQEIELRDILFRQAVVTAEEFDKHLYVTFTPHQDEWKVVIVSQKTHQGRALGTTFDENMECRLLRREHVKNPKRFAAGQFIEHAPLKWDMDALYELARRSGINHYEFMKTLGTVYQKDDEEVINLHLSEVAESFRRKFYAHPAFLDGSTFAGLSFNLSGKSNDIFYGNVPYIPFMIKRFCIYKPLPGEIFTYTQRKKRSDESSAAVLDIVKSDITVWDETGEMLVEFEELTLKRIREPGLIKNLLKLEAQPEIVESSSSREKRESIVAEPAAEYVAKEGGNITAYLQKEIAGVLEKDSSQVNTTSGFYELGLDSAQLLGLVGSLEKKVGKQLYPTLLFEYSSIHSLSGYLRENHPEAFTSAEPAESLKVVQQQQEQQEEGNSALLFYRSVWDEEETQQVSSAKPGVKTHVVVVLCEEGSPLPSSLQEKLGGAEVLGLEARSSKNITESFEDRFIRLFEILQKMLRRKEKGQVLLQVLAEAEGEGRLAYACGGLLRTACLENPKISGQIITVEQISGRTAKDLARLLQREAAGYKDGCLEVCYRGEPLRRYRKKLREIRAKAETEVPWLKENGVYLITGGLGGLGILLAGYLAGKGKVKLALLGRQELSIKTKEQLRQLRKKGTEVLYCQGDVGKKEDVVKALEDIKKTLGPLAGVFHCAGVLKDKVIIQKKQDEIKEVFRPKVHGLWNLDEAVGSEKLDFFVAFSSLSAVLGNLGQADYASANAFMDSFAELRRLRVEKGERFGKTMTVNWPLWSAGGMKVDYETEKKLYHDLGLSLLPTVYGLSALEAVMAQEEVQSVVLYGHEERIKKHLDGYNEGGEATVVGEGSKARAEAEIWVSEGRKAIDTDEVAIIGLAGRYPRSETIEEYYRNLREGKDCITGFPRERWKNYRFSYDVEKFYRYGGFLEGIDCFDPLFFNISPRQAERMDPQARLFLETAWEACEDAGWCQDRLLHHYPSSSEKSVGVFVGVFWSHYELFGAEITQRGMPLSFGIGAAAIANWVSYCLNLHGPSMAIDSMCSSSLTALHLACESLRKGECHYAIVGGVNLVTHPHKYIALQEAGFLASDGVSRSFGKGGDGYVPGEGVGAVLVTSLSRAEKEGYPIYGLIKGSALNHVGKTAGVTVPDPVAQAEVIADAIKRAGVNPRTIGYLEAHGTGTSLGDPIEVQGLQRAFARWTVDKQFCAIGSCKSNIGHLEAAAGMAGLTKVLLQFKYREIFPSLHAREPNPHIPFGETPFAVAQELRAWQPYLAGTDKGTVVYPRRAGISAFGANGSNAHFIVEEYIKPEQIRLRESPVNKKVLVPLSAASKGQLLRYAEKLLAFLLKEGGGGTGDGKGFAMAGRVADRLLLEKLEAEIQEVLASLLGVEEKEISPQQEFGELTIAYPELLALHRALCAKWGIGLEEKTVLTAGSVSELAAETMNRHGDELAEESDKPTVSFLKEEDLRWLDPVSLAYTLQVGREAQEERVVFLVGDINELVRELQAFIARKGDTGNAGSCFVGSVKKGLTEPEETSGREDKETEAATAAWLKEGKGEQLAELWVRGVKIPWENLYGQEKPRRINLPTYPFAKESYWLPETAGLEVDGVAAAGRMPLLTAGSALHPLLQQNTSDLYEQRYTTSFSGEEFFLADHRVKGKKVLPAAACLEMARAAAVQATGVQSGVVLLKNIVWLRPLVVDEALLQVEIGLSPGKEGEIAFRIYQGETIYSEGTAIVTGEAENSSTVDISRLLEQCGEGVLEAAECYEIFKRMGLEYAPGHQGLEGIHLGKEEVLARLVLPSFLEDTLDEYVLHPGMLDAALQASLGLLIAETEGRDTDKPLLPFALEEMEIIKSCTRKMWAVVRQSGKSPVGSGSRRYDLELCSDDGNVCARLRGLTVREGTKRELAFYVPSWQESNIAQEGTVKMEDGQHVAVLCGGDEQWCRGVAKSLQEQRAGIKCIVIPSPQQEVAARFQDCAAMVLEEVSRIFKEKANEGVLLQVVVPNEGEDQVLAGLSGFLRTARLENPRLVGQVVEVPQELAEDSLVKVLRENDARTHEDWVRYRDGKRFVKCWHEVTPTYKEEKIPWKKGGVYLLSGGAGGLGRILAEEIVKRVGDVTLILSGRSLLSEKKAAWLKELGKEQGRVIYRQANIADKKETVKLIKDIVKEYGPLNGIIHCAGVLRDSFVINKTGEELREVMAPKVAGLVNLDEASKDLRLDFFLLFSSGAAVLGNIGQADYAAANAFMDVYADFRRELVNKGQRRGRMLSLNWPLWKDGGMQPDERTMGVIEENMGMAALTREEGLRALYRSFAGEESQVMVTGSEFRLPAFLRGEKEVRAENTVSYADGEGAGEGAEGIGPEKVEGFLKKLLSAELKLPPERIEADALLEKYGIDSVMVLRLTNELEKTFGSLSKTLFFEYRSIRELSGYFLEFHRGRLFELIKTGQETPVGTMLRNGGTPRFTAESGKAAEPYGRRRFLTKADSVVGLQKESAPQNKEIAVIGLAGRYPGARNIREFWQVLREGRDCITEIPRERWDHSQYYDEEKGRAGKTYSKWGGFLEGADEFDSLFFNISPREAELLDPQTRLFLECAYAVMEDAGYTRKSLATRSVAGLKNNVGVYVGVMYEDYLLLGTRGEKRQNGGIIFPNTSSIANRVSYSGDFHGPSMVVNTMCSSSLTSLHLACRGLQRGECEVALAGGVNLSLHPQKYLSLAQANFMSSKGRCESFGKDGDGYVPGEGVGAILLKPLAQAEEDGDHIYGVIKGTALNHGGKTNGYTVPNPQAQSAVIISALEEAGIDPRLLSYLEAHGTGTILGDPIEINALTAAFRKYTQDVGFCAIGSVKSNIGHCESAAGIAGVTKVLLQLKYGQLVPSLHSELLNPHIDFDRTPFVVQREGAEWKRPQDGMEGGKQGQEQARIAGVSSFGAGGANAHVVIAEYIPEKGTRETRGTVPVVLSAKNEERLKEQAAQLAEALAREEYMSAELEDVAYTLQVGREAMSERLGIIAGSVGDLADKLRAFAKGNDEPEGIYRGQAKDSQEEFALFSSDEDIKEAVDKWIAGKKYAQLLQMWVKGFAFDWLKLYPGRRPRRISLPTYPFARERFPLPEIGSSRAGGSLSVPSVTSSGSGDLHPLLARNTSDLSEQRYTTVFTGQEFFLSDHVVKGRRILPGVVYLEMARAAVALAAGDFHGREESWSWQNVVWSRPCEVSDIPQEVHVGLYPVGEKEIAFEIYSTAVEDPEERVVYSQGSALLLPFKEPKHVDIEGWKQACSREVILAEDCYEAFRKMGIEYGPGHRGIERIYKGEGVVLARLALPDAVSGTLKQYVLHPALLDAALQAAVGFSLKESALPTPALPFALDSLEVFGNCTQVMWALLQAKEQDLGHSGNPVIEIELSDAQGVVCARMKGLVTRPVAEKKPPRKTADVNPVRDAMSPEAMLPEGSKEKLQGKVMLLPVWDAVTPAKGREFPAATQRVVVIGGQSSLLKAVQLQYPQAAVLSFQPGEKVEEIAKKLGAQGEVEHLIWLPAVTRNGSPQDEQLFKEQKDEVIQVLRIIKALLGLGYGDKGLGWTLLTAGAQAAVHGLSGVLAKEYPHWQVRVVELGAGDDRGLAEVFKILPHPGGEPFCYRNGEWFRQKLIPLEYAEGKQTLYREGGVYVVIGGAGGIGEVWSEYMIKTYRAQIIWLGRRKQDHKIEEKIERLARLGPAPIYIQADATKLEDMEKAYGLIKESHPQINGIVHAAIVLRDGTLANMQESDFLEAFGAKADVCLRLAQVFKGEKPDFVLFFSSAQSFAKPPGQGNYTAGCLFKDDFAKRISREWGCPGKVMNWGYWGQVGAVASSDYERRMAQAGIASIVPDEAMEALEGLLSGSWDQCVLLNTTGPLAMEGVTTEEVITAYPAKLPGVVDRLPREVLPEDSRLQLAVASRKQQEEMEELLGRILLAKIATRAGILPSYERWLGESIARITQVRGEGPASTEDEGELWQEWEEKKAGWPENTGLKARAVLVERTLAALPDVLTGKRAAPDVVFPEASFELVDGIYRDNPLADYCNEVLAKTAASYIKELLGQEPKARLRLLEIGAGTGGTTSVVLEKLQPYREQIAEYCYTDISRSFLLYGEREFSSRAPYLTCQVFDVEKPPTEQGVAVDHYDLVIAANVLHATRNMRQTLGNAKAVLKQNGLLLINEISESSLFLHLTFGLLEGWWRHEDPLLRISGCPGLYPHGWQNVLEAEGFRQVFFPAEGAHDLGQQIVGAASDGLIRQKSTKPSKVEKQVIPLRIAPVRQGLEASDDLLRQRLTAYLKGLVGETLKIAEDKIDTREDFRDYGVDSILVIQLTNALRQVLADVSTALFFEYPTIDALSEHFLRTQRDALLKLWGGEERESPAEKKAQQEEKGLSRLYSPGTVPYGSRRQQGRFLQRREHKDGIAVIGLAGRYPQAEDVYEYWLNLKAGKDCIREVPRQRREIAEEEWSNSWGGFMDEIDKFDPLFFRISPQEAEKMDPQERLFLQTAYACIEDAGYRPDRLCPSGKTGVFVGVMNGNYSAGTPYWSIANRVSYCLNLQGPSMTVDTACSSSLTALHLAVESLSNGVSECALVGGVNLVVDPVHYRRLTAMNMLSVQGKCRVFGEGADGFVVGEGVGAVLLKPLAQAIADKDHIYGVIKGTGINAGGKTGGYTVPNPQAQARVVRETLQKSGIHARRVSYLEAHGTGTALGDPIEIAGLCRAFGEDTQDKQFCAIGSAKSNIGHTESASGIAGLTKVLLQLKYGLLVPSLHSRELNPEIDFAGSPFVVQQELKEWKRPALEIDGVRKEYPRIAGISSFGAGGANAHVIVEEYVQEEQGVSATTMNTSEPVMIVLSAQDEEGLIARAKQLLALLAREETQTEFGLKEMAYTLQVGRMPLEERLGLLASSRGELAEKLQDFLCEKQGSAGLYRGQVKRKKGALAVLAADEEMQETLNKWLQRKKYGRILEMWVQGLDFDWNQLYQGEKPRRMSLPTYPFAKESYWLKGEQKVSVWVEHLHPLLHRNTSDLTEQRFSTVFTGKETFLIDHVIRGKSVLPGVVYLEMARAAAEHAGAVLWGEKAPVMLQKVVWLRPLVVEEGPVKVDIGLYPQENGEIGFEVYSGTDGGTEENKEPVVFCRGEVKGLPSMTGGRCEIAALQEACGQRIMTKEECYEAFCGMGLEYGPGQQGLERIEAGQGQALARLFLPSVGTVPVAGSVRSGYVLSPGIMDAALQSVLGLSDGQGELKPALPFALEEMTVFGALAPSMWAHVRYSQGSTAGDRIRKFDIDVCDEEGNIAVMIKGYSTREMAGGVELKVLPLTETFLLKPAWREKALGTEKEAEGKGISLKPPSQRLIIFCEPSEEFTGRYHLKGEGFIEGGRTLLFASREKSLADRFQEYAAGLLEEIKKLCLQKTEDEVLIQVVVSSGKKRRQAKEAEVLGALAAMLKTARLENPRFRGQVIEIEDLTDIEGILAENSRYPLETRISYREGKRLVESWQDEGEPVKAEAALPWREGGRYLITGGLGGLGFIVAQDIVQKAPGSLVILTGRSQLDGHKKTKLQELQRLGETGKRGTRIEYRQLDVNDRQAVVSLFAEIRKEFGGLEGIIHSAGVIRDSLILKKTKEDLLEVLSPKTTGLVNLDEAGKELTLDFIVAFSSLAGAFGNVGQAGYAAANSFMDVYALYRKELTMKKQRQGRMISIAWPLWEEGGMGVDEITRAGMKDRTGLWPLDSKNGLQALYQAVAFGEERVLVAKGDPAEIRDKLLQSEAVEAKAETRAETRTEIRPDVTGGPACETKQEESEGEAAGLERETAIYLKTLLSEVLKLPPQKIDEEAPLEKYGIDSVMVMQLTTELEKTFGALSKTLFFEYQSILELAQYFLENHRGHLSRLLRKKAEQTAVSHDKNEGYKETYKEAVAVGTTPEDSGEPRKVRFTYGIGRTPGRYPGFYPGPSSGETTGAMDIAVIGLAGRYPGARNLREFWQNLCQGVDSITEIPRERWDYSQYYDEEKGKPGKTYSKWGGFLEGAAEFDPLFFNITPREAELMDPQGRLFLQCVHEVLEDAGYTRGRLKGYRGNGLEGNVGVYVGVMNEDYALLGAREQAWGRPVVLAGNPSAIANRVSYFYNFHGPSMAVDTMCSSSLTAIHLACRGIQKGECEMALAGGVNLSLHPGKYIMLGENNFVSSKGRCESFGEGGDGYVPSEGVGAVLLKPLTKAIAEQDQIYGVIKATVVNHGGKTNGYTVPNPQAQADVIGRAFREADIDPRTIGYVEAHGTGTILGDPIEITGLSKAFREYTQDAQFCAIGSVKSNIGHSESAAGIAGLTKVLLQLKYGRLVPSLHCAKLNSHIDFAQTPFVVQQDLAEWKRPLLEEGGKMKEYPRLAGLSAFGAGGSNAHLVVEEYREQDQLQTKDKEFAEPAAIVLSAKNEARLQERAEQLIAFLEELGPDGVALHDLAYTLQIGREEMEERLALVAGTIPELVEKLKGFLEGKEETELYRGQVRVSSGLPAVFAADEDLEKTIAAWLAKKKYGKLLEFWVQGASLDWERLYEEVKPRRISLPTYPFAQEEYWAPQSKRGKTVGEAAGIGGLAVLHPLLHRNTSDFKEQRYSSRFMGGESFLAEHIVRGKAVLPGIAYLEMARAAREQALGEGDSLSAGLWFKKLVWSRPLVVAEQTAPVHIRLFLKEREEVAYEIYRASSQKGGEVLVYGQGVMAGGKGLKGPGLEIEELKGQCDQNVIEAAQYYESWQKKGYEFGPVYRGLEKLYLGRGQVLAKVSLPASLVDTQERYGLHPVLLEAVLQAGVMLSKETERPGPLLPLALEEAEFYGTCPPILWVLINRDEGGQGKGNLLKLDLTLAAEDGTLWAAIKGFTVKPTNGPVLEPDKGGV